MSRRSKPDSMPFEQSVNGRGYTWFVLVGVALLFVFGFTISFSGLYMIAPWTGIPPVLYVCVPLAIDLAILVYKVAEVKLKLDEREERRKKARKATAGVWLFTIFSSAGNLLHVLTGDETDPVRLVAGATIAGAMPWAVLLAASVLTDILVAPKATAQEPPSEVGPEVEHRVQAGDGLPAVEEGSVDRWPDFELAPRPDPELPAFQVGRTVTLEEMNRG